MIIKFCNSIIQLLIFFQAPISAELNSVFLNNSKLFSLQICQLGKFI